MADMSRPDAELAGHVCDDSFHLPQSGRVATKVRAVHSSCSHRSARVRSRAFSFRTRDGTGSVRRRPERIPVVVRRRPTVARTGRRHGRTPSARHVHPDDLIPAQQNPGAQMEPTLENEVGLVMFLLSDLVAPVPARGRSRPSARRAVRRLPTRRAIRLTVGID
jgi:hypothetical protein